MIRKRSTRRLIGMILFVLVVAVSGYALSASGNLSNPFTAVSQMAALLSGSTTAPGEMGAGSGETRGAPPSGERPAGGGEMGSDQSAIQWSQIGAVLYNVWVIAAASAVMMLVGPVIGWGIKQFRRGIQRLTPTRAPA